MILVIDAGVAAQWYFPEDNTEAAEKLLTEDFDLHAPQLILAEFGNILWKKCRAGDIVYDQAEVMATDFLRRKINYHSLASILISSLTAANTFGQPIYDWTYLMLAKSLDCKFVTADWRFFRSVRSTVYKKDLMWIEELL